MHFFSHRSFKHIGMIVVLFSASLVFAGCASQSTTSKAGVPETDQTPSASEKQGNTTKTGVISQVNGQFYLQQSTGTPELIESLSVDLSEYVGQTVTLTGQYSGDTLFIGSVE